MSSLKVLNQRNFLVQYKTSIPEVTDVNVINANAWVQTAINMGMQMEISPFDKKKLTEAITQIRDMTVQEPKIFYPQLKELLSECGVALVLLPNLKNCGIDGAVKWLGKDKVVLALNDRRKYADVLIQRLEREANIFSQNVLIPRKEL